MATLGAFHYGATFSIIFPLAECSLEGYLQGERSYSSNYIWTQMHGVAEGLAFLHGLRHEKDGKNKKQTDNEESIIIAYHLDLKPENILVMRRGANEESVIFQIADFGLSTIQNKILAERSEIDSGDAGNQAGFMAFAPPEQQRHGNRHYGAHDVWSFGAILSEVATHDIRPSGKAQPSLLQYRKDRALDREHTYYGSKSFHNGRELKESVHSQHRQLLRSVENKYSEEPSCEDVSWRRYFYQRRFFELITKMLGKEPTERGTALDVANTLQRFLKDTKMQQDAARANLRVDFRPTLIIQNIWEEAQAGKLQMTYGIPPGTHYMYEVRIQS